MKILLMSVIIIDIHDDALAIKNSIVNHNMKLVVNRFIYLSYFQYCLFLMKSKVYSSKFLYFICLWDVWSSNRIYESGDLWEGNEWLILFIEYVHKILVIQIKGNTFLKSYYLNLRNFHLLHYFIINYSYFNKFLPLILIKYVWIDINTIKFERSYTKIRLYILGL